jgi:hypothetical protein
MNNQTLTHEIMSERIEKYKTLWDWTLMSRYLPFEYVEARPDLPWDWTYVSMNASLTFEHVHC